ncbi:hypothetical protein HanIR_Chr05g0246591 [Helianthus annuus]|nr:hypothetical protein HanIR_Chr05g0246591 [Helianthus annuus]
MVGGRKMESLSDSSAIMICPDLRGDRVSRVSIPFIDQMAESGAHVVMVVRNTKAAHELI